MIEWVKRKKNIRHPRALAIFSFNLGNPYCRTSLKGKSYREIGELYDERGVWIVYW